MSSDTITENGERVVIFNDSSPPYRLVSVSYEDLSKASGGKYNPVYRRNINLIPGALPSEVKLTCSSPFGDGIRAYVGRVSPYSEKGYYIEGVELDKCGEWGNHPGTSYVPLDSRYNQIRLEIECDREPTSGLIYLLIEFRFMTNDY